MLNPQTASRFAFLDEGILGLVKFFIIQHRIVVEQIERISRFNLFRGGYQGLNRLDQGFFFAGFDFKHLKIGKLAFIDFVIKLAHPPFKGFQAIAQIP